MSVLQAALDYHKLGWSVIPVSPRGKKPLVSWKRYQDRLPTPDRIRAWFRKHPDANVGIVTGETSGLVVVDFDVHRGADPKAFAKRFPTPLVVKTGGGGFHYYFAFPEGETIRNSVGEDGVDIRATGGFVVAPPSVHATGKRYRWVKRNESAEPRQRAATRALEKDRGSIIPWVFHRRGQRLIDYKHAWTKACVAAGHPGMLVHDLRRTAVRNLERACVPRSVATKLTGHKTEAVYRRYAITNEQDLAEGIAKLAKLHGAAPNRGTLGAQYANRAG